VHLSSTSHWRLVRSVLRPPKSVSITDNQAHIIAMIERFEQRLPTAGLAVRDALRAMDN
jgi:hypothetical protein